MIKVNGVILSDLEALFSTVCQIQVSIQNISTPRVIIITIKLEVQMVLLK